MLVVDDRPTTRSLVRSVLEEAEYRVYEASDGYKALSMIESKQPDVILLDIVMPGMDGLETLRKIRQRWDEIELPVIMLTVKDTMSDIVTTLELGATDFLSKPINFPILMARLNRHLHRKKLSDQIQQMRGTLEQKVEFRTKQLVQKGHELEASLSDLRFSEHRYSTFYNDTPAVFMTLDVSGLLLSINRFGADYLGWAESDITGKPVANLFHKNQVSSLMMFIKQIVLGADTVHHGELLMLNRDGEHVWMRLSGRAISKSGGPLELLLAGEDVSESYRMADRLAYLSDHDELTGLLNRVELTRRLEKLVEEGADNGVNHVLCLLDIDQFRVINDTHGHVIGDRYLCALGRKLGSLLGPSDIVARVGGDEFALLLSSMNVEDARPLVKRIRSAIEAFRFDLEGGRIGATTSIGMVPIESGSVGVTEVMTRADAACYCAKQNGGNSVYLFKSDDHIVERHYEEVQWVSRIQKALDGDLFEFFAQEIVPTREEQDSCHSLELLLRLRRSDGSYVPNNQMVSAVEEYHYGLRLDKWVIQHAFRTLSDFGVTKGHHCKFSINLSGQSLGQSAFFNHVLDQFKFYGISPELICFEVTESAAIGNIEKASEFFEEMRRRGCSLALDDFGSGLSSYSYLKQIPADILKIDGSFIRQIDGDRVKLAIVDSIIRLAKKLGKQTIAEQVEDQVTRDLLVDLGADMLQGNLLGAPRQLSDFFNASTQAGSR